MFKRIDHVEIVTDRLDRTVEFYTDVLGFAVRARDRIERSGLGTPIDLVYLELGGTTDDMQETVEYLKTKGVDIVWGPRLRETYARAEICDPGGNHIELRQWFRAL